MHGVLVNRLGGLSLPRKRVVRLTDRPDMTLDVYRGRKTTIQQIQQQIAGKLFLSLHMIKHSFLKAHYLETMSEERPCNVLMSEKVFFS